MSKQNQNLNADDIRCIRERLGLGRTEFANLLGLGNQGERTVRGWENGEHLPSAKKAEAVRSNTKQ